MYVILFTISSVSSIFCTWELYPVLLTLERWLASGSCGLFFMPSTGTRYFGVVRPLPKAVYRMVSQCKARKIFSASFFCGLDGLSKYRRALHCTVTDFCFPCHPWYNRTKEVYTEGSLWKNESGRQLVRNFQDSETWAAGHFELHACTTFTSIERHHGVPHSPPPTV